MYCPSCGSNNVAEVKFCTRCGTNLGAVSDALAGRPSDKSQLDERMVKLFKEYYRGRNSVIIGGSAIAIVLLKALLFAMTRFQGGGGVVSTLTTILLVYGIVALIWGAGSWSNSASEIKAIERTSSRGGARPALLSSEPVAISTGALSTDPTSFQGSVTEQTTRQLEEHGYQPNPENLSKQTQ